MLVAIFGEKESTAVYFLNQRGVTRRDVVNYIAHGITKTPQQKQEKPEQKGDRNDAKRLSQHQRQDKPAPAAGAMAAAFAKLKS